MLGKMSVGVRSAANAPNRAIIIPNTTKVYGFPSAIRTIHTNTISRLPSSPWLHGHPSAGVISGSNGTTERQEADWADTYIDLDLPGGPDRPELQEIVSCEISASAAETIKKKLPWQPNCLCREVIGCDTDQVRNRDYGVDNVCGTQPI
jgi:hypothetical protein